MFRKIRIIPAVLSAGLVILEVAFMSPAHADTLDASVAQTVVSYSDLSLDRTGDVAKLFGRIERAARQACHAEAGPSVRAHVAARQCEETSVAQAVARVSHPNLTALYAARTGSGSRIASR